MFKKKNYTIVEGKDILDLEFGVSDLMERGWKVSGSLQVLNYFNNNEGRYEKEYYQPMVK